MKKWRGDPPQDADTSTPGSGFIVRGDEMSGGWECNYCRFIRYGQTIPPPGKPGNGG